MNVNRSTLYQLFGRNIRHVVPLFQRQYVWSLDRQWLPLWKDITNKADEYIEYRYNGGLEPTQHFLGAVVLNSLRFHGFQVPSELVIDGQQRLTTMQVVMRALSDYAKLLNHTQIVRNLESQLTNQGSMEHEFECYKVWPTNADQKVYQDVFKAGTPENLERIYPVVRLPRHKYPEPQPRLVEAYLFFYNSIKDYAESADLPENCTEDEILQAKITRLEALVQTLMYYLELVKIDLDEKDNPQVIFETLNYRGEPLTPSDLIRNFVFLEVRNQRKNDNDLYNQYWLPYDQAGVNGSPNFWKQQEKSGRYLYQRMDLFVFHYLVMQTGRSISVGRLYQEFTKWWNEEKPDVVTELQSFQRYSDAYRRLLQPDLSTRRGRLALNLRILDITTIYPLMLFLFETCKDEISTADLEGIAIDFESYLVRRSVCNLTAKNYNNVFLAMLNSLKQQRKQGQPMTRAAVQSLLLQSQADTARWPDNDEFQHAWMEYPVYQFMRGRVRVLLEGLDRYMDSKYSEPVIVDYNKATIEHLLPQTWHENLYPLPAGDVAITKPRRDTQLHTMGNLTLLTQALNGLVSNGPFPDKRNEIAVQSKIRLNSYFQTAPDQWLEGEIWNRGLKLFQDALVVWPRP